MAKKKNRSEHVMQDAVRVLPRRSPRWPDGTPRSSNNAFTGDFPRPHTEKPTRAQMLNGADPPKGVIPWDGPYTVRGPRR